MGKRELLIVVAFVAVGMAAWRLTAPAAPAGQTRLSLDTVAEILGNRNPASPAARPTITTQGRIALDAALAELRISAPATVEVRGEDRDDVAWTLNHETAEPGSRSGRVPAEGPSVRHETVGELVDVTVRTSDEPPRQATLTLQVPRRLRVRVESARGATLAEVSGVRLENLAGDLHLRAIDGAVDGTQRSGSLSIDGAGDIGLTLVGTSAVFRGVRGTVHLNVRNGSTRLEHPAGPVDVETNSGSVVIVEPVSSVRASSTGGAIEITHPGAPVAVEARRSRVAIELDRAEVVTVFASGGDVRLIVSDIGRIGLDVVSDAGAIDASAVGLEAIEKDGRSYLVTTAGSSARVSIRNERGSIVIVPGK